MRGNKKEKKIRKGGKKRDAKMTLALSVTGETKINPSPLLTTVNLTSLLTAGS